MLCGLEVGSWGWPGIRNMRYNWVTVGSQLGHSWVTVRSQLGHSWVIEILRVFAHDKGTIRY